MLVSALTIVKRCGWPPTGCFPRIAIALYGDPDRAGDVYGTLNNKYDRTAADTVRECNEMAHTGAPAGADLKELISRSASLAMDLAAL